MGDVPEGDRRLGVREVLELVVVREVADGPDAGHVGGHRVVDRDGAVVVTLEAGGVDVEEVAVRLAAGGNEDLVDDRLADGAGDLDAVVDPLDLGGDVAEQQLDALDRTPR